MPQGSDFIIRVEKADSGRRLDLLIASRISVCSRAAAGSLIRAGEIRVAGAVKKPGYRVKCGDEISGRIPPPASFATTPEPIDLDILFEDEHLIVVNKPAGLVVHPAPGHYTGTLVHGLLYYCPQLEGVGGERRAGIVHRLDKDTSGILLVAKNTAAHKHLAGQFKLRKVQKIYLALVHGELEPDSGTIALPIGRHPVARKQMSTISAKTRHAETSWQIRERFMGATLLDIDLKTGRTHQIRVHCKAIGHPVVGDSVYGSRRSRKVRTSKKQVSSVLSVVSRQMLHARRLEFIHPAAKTSMAFESPIPPDMQAVIDALRRIDNI